MDAITMLSRHLTLRGPATESVLREVSRGYASRLPPAYLHVMRHHDGGEGEIGRLDMLQDLAPSAIRYEGIDHLDRWLIFGTDGGLEAFGFDAAGLVSSIPWIGGADDAVAQGPFDEFVQRWVTDALFTPRQSNPHRR